MNAIITLDSILEPSQALAPAFLFGTGQINAIISAIESQVRAEAYDITTAEGRERIKSVAYKVARSKTTLDEIGKEHVAEIKKQSAAIDAERRTIRDRLDSLKDEVRGPLTRWEEAESNRVSSHEGMLAAIISSPRQMLDTSAAAVRSQIEHIASFAGRDWEEFKERGDTAIAEALAVLNPMLAASVQREKDASELEALRQEKAERDARDAADRQRIAAEQAEQERKARRDADEAARQEQLAAWKAEQEARAARQAEEAAARAVEQERQRAAAEEARKTADKAAQEAAERKRSESKRRRDKVHGEITLALSEVLTGNSDEATALIAAIVAGKIPHVSITY